MSPYANVYSVIDLDFNGKITNEAEFFGTTSNGRLPVGPSLIRIASLILRTVEKSSRFVLSNVAFAL